MIQAERITNNPQSTRGTSKVHGFTSHGGASKLAGALNPIIPNITHSNNTKSRHKALSKRVRTVRETFFEWWHKIAVILLTALCLYGIYDAVRFMAVDCKQLEHQLAIHKIQESDVNFLLSQVFIISIVTLINMFMALRLSKVREKKANNIDLLIATTMIIGTFYFQKVLTQFDLLNSFVDLFFKK